MLLACSLPFLKECCALSISTMFFDVSVSVGKSFFISTTGEVSFFALSVDTVRDDCFPTPNPMPPPFLGPNNIPDVPIGFDAEVRPALKLKDNPNELAGGKTSPPAPVFGVPILGVEEPTPLFVVVTGVEGALGELDPKVKLNGELWPNTKGLVPVVLPVEKGWLGVVLVEEALSWSPVNGKEGVVVPAPLLTNEGRVGT